MKRQRGKRILNPELKTKKKNNSLNDTVKKVVLKHVNQELTSIFNEQIDEIHEIKRKLKELWNIKSEFKMIIVKGQEKQKKNIKWVKSFNCSKTIQGMYLGCCVKCQEQLCESPKCIVKNKKRRSEKDYIFGRTGVIYYFMKANRNIKSDLTAGEDLTFLYR